MLLCCYAAMLLCCYAAMLLCCYAAMLLAQTNSPVAVESFEQYTGIVCVDFFTDVERAARGWPVRQFKEILELRALTCMCRKA